MSAARWWKDEQPSRMELSALDYAIACLARGQRPESLSQLPGVLGSKLTKKRKEPKPAAPGQKPKAGGDAYSRAVQEVADAERARRRGDAPPLAVFFDRGPVSRNCAEYARRIVRARLALCLRLVRRVEAWERGDRRAAWRESFRYVDMGDHLALLAWATPWHPLWLDAPAHEPGVTARQRRERCPECGRSLLVSPMPVCIQCHRESA